MSNYARAEMPAVYSYTGPAFLLFLMVPYCDTDRFIV